MQPRLHLTEDQYNHWSAKHHVLLVEFESAQKIGVIHVAAHKIADRSGWIVFEEFRHIIEVAHERRTLTPQSRKGRSYV